MEFNVNKYKAISMVKIAVNADMLWWTKFMTPIQEKDFRVFGYFSENIGSILCSGHKGKQNVSNYQGRIWEENMKYYTTIEIHRNSLYDGAYILNTIYSSNPSFQKDIWELRKVQRMVTRMIRGRE